MAESANAYYFARIAAERERQDKKFGKKNQGRSLTRYISVATEEFGEGVAEINSLLEEVDHWNNEDMTEAQFKTLSTYFDLAETEMVEAMACILLLLTNMRAGTYRLS